MRAATPTRPMLPSSSGERRPGTPAARRCVLPRGWPHQPAPDSRFGVVMVCRTPRPPGSVPLLFLPRPRSNIDNQWKNAHSSTMSWTISMAWRPAQPAHGSRYSDDFRSPLRRWGCSTDKQAGQHLRSGQELPDVHFDNSPVPLRLTRYVGWTFIDMPRCPERWSGQGSGSSVKSYFGCLVLSARRSLLPQSLTSSNVLRILRAIPDRAVW